MDVQPFVFALYLHNHPGVLNRVALVFSRRGWNIDGVSISPAEDSDYARCNIMATGPASNVRNITAQLNKIVDVVSARQELLDHEVLSREVVLVKIAIDDNDTSDLRDSARELDCQLVDVSGQTAIFQFVGTAAHTRAIRERIEIRHTILDVIRSGAIVMPRGDATSRDVVHLGPDQIVTAQGR